MQFIFWKLIKKLLIPVLASHLSNYFVHNSLKTILPNSHTLIFNTRSSLFLSDLCMCLWGPKSPVLLQHWLEFGRGFTSSLRGCDQTDNTEIQVLSLSLFLYEHLKSQCNCPNAMLFDTFVQWCMALKWYKLWPILILTEFLTFLRNISLLTLKTTDL